MIILGIETSCDETGVGIIEKKGDKLNLLSNVVASSLALHSQNGGIIPELAAREQVKFMIPVLQQALDDAFSFKLFESTKSIPPLDAIAVTYGPGLIGSLLVGVETAKTLSFLWRKPLVPVNHMHGHISANFIGKIASLSKHASNKSEQILFPALILVVSGGHTDLLLMRNYGNFEVIGGTRDDAAGEAFDKIARLLGLPYPGGPSISQAASNGNEKFIHFPRPLIHEDNFDFSFSGLKTAVYREVEKYQQDVNNLSPQLINDLSASTQAAIVDVLVKKTLKAANIYKVESILLSGGVAANNLLRQTFLEQTTEQLPKTKVFAPSKIFCTDNGAMIAAAGALDYKPMPWQDITADAQLYY